MGDSATIALVWEDRYSRHDDYLFGREPAHVLSENPWAFADSTSALCVADGEGRNSVFLAQAGLDVTTFDLSSTAIDRTDALAESAGVTVNAAASKWGDWDWSQTYDLVVAIFVQFAGPDQRPQQFADLRSATKPGGRILLHGFTPKQIEYGTGGPPVAENMYTEGMLADAFGDWNILRLASYEREQTSGTAHVGKAALIDLIVERPAVD